MPLALTLVILCGLVGPGGLGCLQCDQSVLEALHQLREAIIPKRFHVEGLQARAQALLLSMEGPFFRDYAMNAFVGKVGVCLGAWGRGPGSFGPSNVTRPPFWSTVLDQLETVVTSFKNQTQYIQANSRTGGSPFSHLLAFLFTLTCFSPGQLTKACALCCDV